MAHYVGHSKLKELDMSYFFQRKHMNEAMESELNEIDSRTDNLTVT